MITRLKSLPTKQFELRRFPSKHLSNLPLQFFSSCSSSSSSASSTETPLPRSAREVTTTATTTSATLLSQQELTKINLLIPRLCLTNNLNTAIHLTITALLTNPPSNSLSLSILIHSLTSLPDLAASMSLLTKLKHSPEAHPHLDSVTKLLINSYLKKGRPKDALKVYNWMVRPGSPCKVEKIVFHVLVDGLCRKGLVFEGLRVLRDMVGINLVVKGELRNRVFRGLLREARVKEATALDEALGCVGDGGGEGLKKVSAVLDRMIATWTD